MKGSREAKLFVNLTEVRLGSLPYREEWSDISRNENVAEAAQRSDWK